MSKPPETKRRGSAAEVLRSEIERAEARGVLREDMLLRLTLSDVDRLRRDRSLAVADISFTGGVMRFLGVRIEQGGVAASALECPDPAS